MYPSPTHRYARNAWASLLLPLIALCLAVPLTAQTPVQISADTFTNSDSVHKTEVEPASAAWGSTIVSAFQVARRSNTEGWGAADVGFATSSDGGNSWVYGNLPGLTINDQGGSYGAATDPSVAYDAKHGQWLISTLPLAGLSFKSRFMGDVAVSRSTDGLHWGNPIAIDTTHLDDKDWIVCDNTSSSPYYGHCYTEWDQARGNGEVLMSTSKDGGLTWGPGTHSANAAGGLGGQPLVQPNGTVIVPFESYSGIAAFTSTNGGKSWGRSTTFTGISEHLVAGNLRNTDLPSAAIDGAGRVYVVWDDCRFRTGCTSNDIVFSTSTDGKTWTAPSRIPIDAVSSTVDHFIAGIGADPATAGAAAHLTVVYYYYPVAKCRTSCQLYVGFTTSQDGGATWTAGITIAGPMNLTWLPLSDYGYMVADYVGVSYVNGTPFGVFAVANGPSQGLLHEAIYTTTKPLLLGPNEPAYSSKNDKPVPNAKSNYARRVYYDDEGHFPIPESRRLPDNSQW
jgi:hypothetical protein